MGDQLFHLMRMAFGDNQRYDGFKLGVRTFILVSFLIHIYWFHGVTITALKEDEYNLYSLLHWMGAVLFVVSYYRATYAQTPPIPHLSQFPDDQYGEKGNSWKPERTRHGRICAKGVPKMDHHCPWVANGIGYHNLKFFYLSVIYCDCGLILYADTLIRFAFISGDPSSLSLIGRFFYWMFNIFYFVMIFALTNLIVNITLTIYNNMTTIEGYIGVKVAGPCFPRNFKPDDSIEARRNIYDRLWVNNFSDILGESFWKWLLPIKHEMEGKGVYFPKIPEFEMKDLKGISENNRAEQTFEISESRESVYRYAKTSLYKYKGEHVMIDEDLYKIPEEHPDIPNELHDYDDSD